MDIVNPLKARLAGLGEPVLSLAVRMARGPEIGRIAASAGFDALYVDLEHSPLSLETAAMICTVAHEAGVTPLVRVPGPRSELIGRVLDAGARGVIVPHVDDAEAARAGVAAALYPPHGTRSYATGLAATQHRALPTGSSPADLNAACVVAVMIESASGVAAAAEIAAVPGVDMLFVGAQDLAVDLGRANDPTHAEVVAAIGRVHAAARAQRCAVGIGGLASHPAQLRAQVSAGARFLSLGTDLSLLLKAATEQVLGTREAIG